MNVQYDNALILGRVDTDPVGFHPVYTAPVPVIERWASKKLLGRIMWEPFR